MGKSSKKIKSDRINALKKQYDAFLEEDKKRKDRNEFILGRLDKMRYSTALLPLRHKFGIIPDRNVAQYRSAHQQLIPLARDYQLSCTNPNEHIQDVPVTNVEGVPETFLMQEISKKYILIPKLRSSFTNNFNINDVKPALDIEPIVDSKVKKEVKISDVDNSDWKSKYEILNILKKEEKEEAPIQLNKEALPNKPQKELQNINNIENINESAGIDFNASRKYHEEIPEKDLPDEISHQLSTAGAKYAPTHLYNDRCSVNTNDRIEDQTENSSITSKFVQNDPITEIDYKLQNTNLEYNIAEQSLTNRPAEYTEYEENVQMQTAYEIDTASDNPNQQNVEMQPDLDVNTAFDNSNHQKLETTNPIENVHNTYHAEAKLASPVGHDLTEQIKHTENDIRDENINQAQVITANDFVEQANNVPPPAEPDVGDVEYPIDIINVQEFTPNADVQLREGININPEGHIMQQSNIEPPNTEIPQVAADIEHPQNTVDTVGIEEFEAEQQGMFYTEQPGENYAYQGGAGDVYNPEYAQNEGEYAYYEGTQPEVYQPVELNEHEETTQQYDQNYEQQYVGTYEQGYEQQPYEQQDQQYQGDEAYPSQSEVEQLHYQQQNEETMEHVQQVLDNEQGFDIQNIVQANEQEKIPFDDDEALPEKQIEALEAS